MLLLYSAFVCICCVFSNEVHSSNTDTRHTVSRQIQLVSSNVTWWWSVCCALHQSTSWSRCRNIKKVPQILGSYLSRRLCPTFSYGCNFAIGLIKPQLPDKFEVAGFSRCRNIKGKPQILGSSPIPGLSRFFSEWDFIMGLSKPQQHTKFEVANFSHGINIEGEHSNFGEFPLPRNTPNFSSKCYLWWALANLMAS